jgi:hypothetical protein
MVGLLFSVFVGILFVGFLWFYIARPILEDFGIIRDADVNDSQDAAPVVMSRSEDGDTRLRPSVSQTDNRQTTDSAPRALPSRDVMLDTYKLLRKYGIPREEARPILKAAGLPLDNNLWSQAAPAQNDAIYITPIAGRPTSASYYPNDPDLEFQPPN